MITFKDIVEANNRIQDHIIKTPLIRVAALDDKLGCQVYLKPENFQHTGSFKVRGASNRLLAMSAEERSRGVVCASSGNHAQGVACAAKKLGIDAVIVVPTNCNPTKLAGIQSHGATIILEGTLSSERDAKVEEIVRAQGRTVVPPYDDDYVRAGQGTIGIEILEDEPDLDYVVVPVGGGGLISGIATAVKEMKPQIKVIGAEPMGASRYTLSRQEKKPSWLTSVDTIADGTRTDHANENSFEMIEKLVDQLVCASDVFIKNAMKEVVSSAKLVAEPSSVLGIAAVLEGNCQFKATDKVCFVLTGGNNDLDLLADVLTQKVEAAIMKPVQDIAKTTSIMRRVEELEISLPPFNHAAANYSPAIRTGNMIITAGQTTRFAGMMQYTGRVNDKNLDDGYKAAKLCALNCLGVLDTLAGGLDNISQIIKITGFVNCDTTFTKHAMVMDGATDLLHSIFGNNGRPARSSVGVISLPGNSMCEIELFAELKDGSLACI